MKVRYIKLILHLFIIAIIPYNSFAQVLTLDSPVSGTFEAISNEAVILAPGFSYSPSSGNFFIATVDPNFQPNQITDINYIPENSLVDPNSRQINPNLPVGTVEGNVSVNPLGAATYTIPVVASPGTGGMVPEISINYNSQSGNGILGWGWHLAGLSAITRIGSPYYMGNEVKGVSMSNDDLFAIDGNRLLLKDPTKTYGEDNTEYSTEKETFTTSKSHGQSGNGPLWFSVTTKNNSTLEFGNGENSVVKGTDGTILIWNITKIKDVNGNYIEYIYDTESDQNYLKSIKYTGNENDNLLPYNEIRFSYGIRQDKSSAYYKNLEVKSNLIITRIESWSENELVGSLSFDYYSDFYSFLVGIKKSDGDNDFYNPTIISWKEDPSYTLPYVYTNQNSWDPSKYYVGDFNGDGKDDYVLIPDKDLYTSNDKWELFINQDGQNFIKTDEGDLQDGYIEFRNETTILNKKLGYNQIDYNGDGLSDMVICTFQYVMPWDDEYSAFQAMGYAEPFFKYYYAYYESTGTSLVFDHFHSRSINQQKGHMIYGDFNGDGKTTAEIIYQYLNVVQEVENPRYNYDYYPIDFNGDGKTDIMAINQNDNFNIEDACVIFDGNSNTELYHSGFPNKWQELFPGDYNGDGKTDIMVFANNDWLIQFSTGEGFSWPPVSPPLLDINPSQEVDDNNLIIRDFNSDGKTDIMQMHKIVDGQNITAVYDIYCYNGNDFSLETFTGAPLNLSLEEFYFGDFDGDGTTDLFDPGPNNTSFPNSIKYFKKGHAPYLVESILNGFNLLSSLEYKPLTNNDVYKKIEDGDSPIVNIQPSLYITSRIVKRHSLEIQHHSTYTYEGLRMHREGRGLLGYKKRKIVNEISKDSIVTISSYFPDYYSPYTKLSRTYKGGNLVSETENSQDKNTFDNGKRYFTYINESISKDFVNGTAKTTTKNIDELGDITDQEVKYLDNNNIEVVKETCIFPEYNSSGSPLSKIKTKVRGSEDAIIRNIQFTYDINGRLLSENKSYGPAQNLTTSYTYDIFGNILSKTDSDGTINRGESYIYEDSGKGRFVTSKTNNLGLISYYQYDNKTGNLDEKTEMGITTTYDYDGFGNLTKTTLPTGNEITRSISWSQGSENINDLYYILVDPEESHATYTYYDGLARKVREKTEAFSAETYLIADFEYDNQGRIEKEYLPYLTGTQRDQYIEYEYDNHGRIHKEITQPQNLITEYKYDALETKTTIGGRDYIKNYEPSGLLSQVTEPAGGTISYEYDSEGKVTDIISPSGTTNIDYDIYGYQDKLYDIDAGTIDYDYNIWGELVQQSDEEGNVLNITYDTKGRVDTKIWIGGESLDYDYSPTNGLITSIKSTVPGGSEHIFEYDSFHRLEKKTENIDPGHIYTIEYTYNDNSEITNELINNTVNISYTYNYSNGYLTDVALTDGAASHNIWHANSMNKYGVIDNYDLGNNLNTILTFDQYGYPEYITTTNGSTDVQDWDYDFDYIFGNMSNRKGLISSTQYNEESFNYDLQNRLTTYTVDQNTLSIDYDTYNQGNIISKTDVGSYDYSKAETPLHQVDYINNPSVHIQNQPSQTITYTEFEKVATINLLSSTVNKSLEIDYGVDQLRTKTVYKENGATIYTKYFALGNYEKEIHLTNGTRDLYYINTPSGLSAIYEKKSTGDQLYYVLTDLLGSYDVICDEQGVVLERLSFDPWGRRRNPVTWDYTNVPTSYLFDRGFTGHEHLSDFELINMNGRVYDPLLAVFLSPDNFVQSPGNTQNLNRYAYCLNNPLKYTDPDGEWFLTTLFTVAGGYFGGVTSNNWEWNPLEWDWNSFNTWYSVFTSGFTGYKLGSKIENTILSNKYDKLYNEAYDTYIENYESYVIEDDEMILGSVSILDPNYLAQPSLIYDHSTLKFENGTLSWYDVYNDRSEELVDSWESTSGPWGNGKLPDGQYLASNLRTRTKQSMVRDGVGFSVDLDPLFETQRDLLRIHPDGHSLGMWGLDNGTEGCIGIRETSVKLREFINRLLRYFQRHGRTINLNVD